MSRYASRYSNFFLSTHFGILSPEFFRALRKNPRMLHDGWSLCYLLKIRSDLFVLTRVPPYNTYTSQVKWNSAELVHLDHLATPYAAMTRLGSFLLLREQSRENSSYKSMHWHVWIQMEIHFAVKGLAPWPRRRGVTLYMRLNQPWRLFVNVQHMRLLLSWIFQTIVSLTRSRG